MPESLGRESNTLNICRNKHWRYISSYHGPWLQACPEALDSLSQANKLATSFSPISSAVLSDVARIRRLVDDATGLSIRASNGSSPLFHSSPGAGNNSHGNVPMLFGGGLGGRCDLKLSKERKHRMRELATQKLSEAYHLDEIAASVAMMQSASTLEDVAGLVLRREPAHGAARYVHFFHEKIPSRMISENTSLLPLNQAIEQNPNDASFYRTRAMVKLFKEDYGSAIRDITEAIAICRSNHSQHSVVDQKPSRILSNDDQYIAPGSGFPRGSRNSLELQLLFHRAGAYLGYACQHIKGALAHDTSSVSNPLNTGTASTQFKSQQHDNTMRSVEAKKKVRLYAKRSIKDYLDFISEFQYKPGLSAEEVKSIPGFPAYMEYFRCSQDSQLQEQDKRKCDSAIIGNEHVRKPCIAPGIQQGRSWRSKESELLSNAPEPLIQSLDNLLSPSHGVRVLDDRLVQAQPTTLVAEEDRAALHVLTFCSYDEAVTYHPLLSDALHSILLVHCLLGTSAKEHTRYARRVAHLLHISNGYPVFHPPTSPGRADWLEILRQCPTLIDLGQSWDAFAFRKPRSASADIRTDNASGVGCILLQTHQNLHNDTNSLMSSLSRPNGSCGGANKPHTSSPGSVHCEQAVTRSDTRLVSSSQNILKDESVSIGRAESIVAWISKYKT